VSKKKRLQKKSDRIINLDNDMRKSYAEHISFGLDKIIDGLVDVIKLTQGNKFRDACNRNLIDYHLERAATSIENSWVTGEDTGITEEYVREVSHAAVRSMMALHLLLQYTKKNKEEKRNDQ